MTAVVHDLQKNTVLLTALANNFPDSYISVFNRNLVLDFIAGPAMCEFGSNHYTDPVKSLIGCPLTQVFADYDPSTLATIIDRYRFALRGEPVEFDVTDSGECQHHSVTPIVDQCGAVEQILCFVQNVTEQRRSLYALKESEAHLKVATQLAKIGYWELDIKSLIFTFNDQFLDILKITPDFLGGYCISAQRYADEFLYDEDRSLIQEETQQAINTKDPNFSRYIEHRFIDGNGKSGYLGVRYFVVKDEFGHTVKTIGANQDITERKSAEQALKALLDKTTDQNRRLKDFSFMTSHNIRSSVANLLGLSQMLKDEPANLNYIDMLGATVNELDKTVKNINTLLNFERSLSSDIRVDCNIQSALDRFIELNATWIEKNGVEIISLLPSDMSVSCVPAYIDSIVHNLISNAIKYGVTQTSKRIEVGGNFSDFPAMFVRDFGKGIDLEKHGDKLFKLGRRFHSHNDGQGLGLYMTKHQIESAGGRITVASAPDLGTTFTVYFGHN